MKVFALMLCALTGLPQSVVYQSTSGWCSPSIANVAGDVTVICNGVSPKALQKLNIHLNATLKSLRDKVIEAEMWAQRYHDLRRELTNLRAPAATLESIKDLIERGELDQAADALGRIIEQETGTIDYFAQCHFLRGQVEELNFRRNAAAAEYRRAAELAPENHRYKFAYAASLQRAGEPTKAREVYASALPSLRNTTQSSSQPYVLIRFLNAIGKIDAQQGQVNNALKEYDEAQRICEELTKKDSAYQPLLAETLKRQGDLLRDALLTSQALAKYTAALAALRAVYGQADAAAQRSELLREIALTYKAAGQYGAAARFLKRAIELLPETNDADT